MWKYFSILVLTLLCFKSQSLPYQVNNIKEIMIEQLKTEMALVKQQTQNLTNEMMKVMNTTLMMKINQSEVVWDLKRKFDSSNSDLLREMKTYQNSLVEVQKDKDSMDKSMKELYRNLEQMDSKSSSKIDLLNHDLIAQNKKLDDLQMNLVKLDEKCSTERLNIDHLQEILENKLALFQEKQNEVERKLDQLNKTSTWQQTSSPNSSFYIWKVENFSDLPRKVYSDPFYTNQFGYKMRLLLYPSGSGTGYRSHLSVYLQIMTGPNDAILKWPIDYTAELSLLNQVHRTDHSSVWIRSNSCSVTGSLDRPVNEVNNGCGISKFFPLDNLYLLYLIDDVIFIKVNVHINS